jgi:hypothetical protein
MMKRAFAVLIIAALMIGAAPRLRGYAATLGVTRAIQSGPAVRVAVLATPQILATATPTPIPTATKFETPAPGKSSEGTPVPHPSGNAVFFSAQVLDVEHGYIFFTTGDAFKLSPAVHSVWIDNGQPAPLPDTRMYAQAIFDGSGQIIELQVANHALPFNAAYVMAARKYAVALSPPVPNTDQLAAPPGSTKYNNSRLPLTGKIVSVRFVVEVPPNTPLSDAVYLSTDVSGWNPQAIRMERIDALHYSVTMPLRTGTIFAYKYTRGSWQSEERSKTGIAESPRHFFLGSSPFGEPDTSVRDDTVYNWADYNPAGGQQIAPGATPTPFNPNPFGFPTPLPPPPKH